MTQVRRTAEQIAEILWFRSSEGLTTTPEECAKIIAEHFELLIDANGNPPLIDLGKF